MNSELPFKVKCIDNERPYCLTVGKEYDVIEVDDGFYKVRNDSGRTWWYYDSRFEIVKTPKDKQEFSVGDKVVINKISDDFVSSNDKNVKVGDVATVSMIESCSEHDVWLTNPNWKNAWWFSRNDLSLAEGENHLTHQEVIQAIIDGKELEIQYTDGTWHSFSTRSTTLHQFINQYFRLKPSLSLEDKRKAVIKKLLETKVAVLCKCWDDDERWTTIEAITSISDDYTYPYINSNGGYKNAIAIDDNGNEITNV